MVQGGIEMVRYDITFFSDFDIYLFKEGNHFNAYEKLGSHIIEVDGKKELTLLYGLLMQKESMS